jgi:hypothetical protein
MRRLGAILLMVGWNVPAVAQGLPYPTPFVVPQPNPIPAPLPPPAQPPVINGPLSQPSPRPAITPVPLSEGIARCIGSCAEEKGQKGQRSATRRRHPNRKVRPSATAQARAKNTVSPGRRGSGRTQEDQRIDRQLNICRGC